MFSNAYLCICIYCMLQLGFLFLTNHRRLKDHSVRENYFSLMLVITMVSFAADIVSSLSRVPEWFFPFVAAGNIVEVTLNTTLLPVYFQYVCMQISDINLGLKRRINAVLWILTVICYALGISTIFTKAIFYFDEAKNYHRGSLFWIPMTILFIMMAIIEAFIISQRTKIETSYFKSLLAFILFPLVGWGLQLMVYGLPFSLIGIAFAAQVVFTNIQNRRMDTDYLTGAFNRQALDSYIQSKINATANGHSFSALLIDINNFKSINDSFGHYEGDSALIKATEILRSSVGQRNFISRYGGDEFCVVFDEDRSELLQNTVRDINDRLQEFNEKTKKPYQLSFSIGYAVYDQMIGSDRDAFLKLIDQKMYDDKKSQKEAGIFISVNTDLEG